MDVRGILLLLYAADVGRLEADVCREAGHICRDRLFELLVELDVAGRGWGRSVQVWLVPDFDGLDACGRCVNGGYEHSRFRCIVVTEGGDQQYIKQERYART